ARRDAATASRPSFNVTFSRSAWWVRATLINRDSETRPLVLAIRDARVDRADFYVERHGRWLPDHSFPADRGDAREAPSRYPTLDVTRSLDSYPIAVQQMVAIARAVSV
ncbi:7TM-DISM domain-containing protein, partial [Burkholderia cenocepacia]|nr:7TM-DISM domain-containing protein [Burkholderia cenocepacia]